MSSKEAGLDLEQDQEHTWDRNRNRNKADRRCSPGLVMLKNGMPLITPQLEGAGEQ